MSVDYVAVPHSYLEEMGELTDEEFGRLIRGLISYSLTGESISPVGNERFYIKRVMIHEDSFKATYSEKISAKSERAKKAAAARWGNACASTSNAENANECVSITSNAKNAKAFSPNINNIYNNNIYNTDIDNNNSNISKKEKEKYKKEKEKNISPGDFEKFWKAYPKKQAKEVARSAFKKVDVQVDILIEAIDQQKKSRQWTQDGGKYIPLPSTWLNQKRWEDKLEVEITDKKSEVLAYEGFGGYSSGEDFYIPAHRADVD